MIETLYGRIYEINAVSQSVIIECGGVGYKLTVTANTVAHLPVPEFEKDGLTLAGQPCRLFTHMAVREDAVELYGFFSREELDMFRLLIGVNGIGPKAGMSILSLLTPARLAKAVAAGDFKTISKAPGVGAKTAQRVTLELKDKLAKLYPVVNEEETETVRPENNRKDNLSDAREALAALGYSKSEVASSLKNIDTSAGVEEIIRQALAVLMKN